MDSKTDSLIEILTFNGTYLPGFKAGGPIRSIVNMVDNLSENFNFNIICQDRDFYDDKPYKNIKVDKWNEVNGAKVFYHSPKNNKLSNIRNVVNNTKHDIVYLNGFFSEYTIKYLFLRKLKLIKIKPLIILPRGDLAEGALSLKANKKKLFIKVTKLVGLYKHLTWQATSEEEVESIKKIFGSNNNVYNISNFAPKINKQERESKKIKLKNNLNIIFISRITKVKNIKFAIEQVSKLSGEVNFDIFGPISDQQYWEECKVAISETPENIKINYKGSIENENVVNVLRKADVMFLPTLGENFGHVIVESLLANTPILISDQTPWRDLEKHGVGWDLPLDQPEQFVEKLQYLIELDNEQYKRKFSSINDYIHKYFAKDNKSSMFKKMVRETL